MFPFRWLCGVGVIWCRLSDCRLSIVGLSMVDCFVMLFVQRNQMNGRRPGQVDKKKNLVYIYMVSCCRWTFLTTAVIVAVEVVASRLTTSKIGFSLPSSRIFLRSSRLIGTTAAAFKPRFSPTFWRSSTPRLAMGNPSQRTTASAAGVHLRPQPPVVPRDEQRFVYAGAYDLNEPKQDQDAEQSPILRQAENDINKLLDPPVPVPDPYGILRDDSRSDPFVLQHLQRENEYTDTITAHLTPLRQTLYQEMLQSIQETDYSTPAKDGPFYYYSRTYEGKAYTVHCRAPIGSDHNAEAPKVTWDGSADTPILPNEHILLDENILAAGKSYCSTGTVAVSPNHSHLAYTVDFSGNEKYELHVQDISTGHVLMADDKIECSTAIWGANEQTLFYVTLDEVNRPFRVYRRQWNTDSSNTWNDELLYEEKDDLFAISIGKSSDKKYLFILSSSSETTEIHYLDLTQPTTLQCIATRNKGVLYDVEHWEGYWLLTTNIGKTPNMRLMICPVASECAQSWKDLSWVDEYGTVAKLFDGGATRALDGIDSFQHFAVAHGREEGIPRLWILQLEKTKEHEAVRVQSFQNLQFPESAYDVALGENYEYNTSNIVILYDSLITPQSSLLIDMANPTHRTILKEKNVKGYIKNDYGCERRIVLSRDGRTEIPISIVYRKDVMEKHVSNGEPVPVHLYGYGSYGLCIEADFRATRLPLLNRGIVYVIAHVRGGGEMGRSWYEEPQGAKYLCKQNTFHDFCDVAEWLVNEKKMTTPKLLSCEGRSAGGLLIGASINQRPDLFGVAILGVPFLDVVCTMIDSTIPLTCGEWEEWGNPNTEKYFHYMMSYSPMNNVKQGAVYPSCLIIGGLHDPRVQFWEPAKFAQQLRYHQSPESGPVALKMEMSAGHFSASDRYKYLRELAFDYAFLLDQLGLNEDAK